MPLTRSHAIRTALGFALLAGASAGHAGDSPMAAVPGGWIVTLRGIGALAPSFPGSARLRPYPFPAIDIRRIGEPELFSTPDDGFGFALVDTHGLRFGPVANFVFKRGQRDGLTGVHSVSLTHEIGGFIEYRAGDHFRTRAELRQGIDGHEGFVAALGADIFGGDGRATVSIGPRISLGDNRYANAYFSVTPAESALNGRLAPYEATGGFTSAGGLATFRYDFTKDLNATIYGGLQRLTGSVGASPIPSDLGSRNQFTAGLSIAKSFEIRGFAW
ncbi:MipA/OmpV family protein [Methylosinus sp. Sm6]|uniref:MipA/OmpV family protein n=1 Tax=Methylosinus sp. Sm6 TaxID=2866948 RepID=UPI001C9A0B8D|nr:MipA/OmpV family protein [Methylosinus sp. Sm6]MBY6243142.1 MipA/OmpV family protein [Methylosinus sp. Sm6]